MLKASYPDTVPICLKAYIYNLVNTFLDRVHSNIYVRLH